MIGGEENPTANRPKIEFAKLDDDRSHFSFTQLNLAAKSGALAIPLNLRKVPIDEITAQSKIDGYVAIGESKQLEELKLKAAGLTGLPLESRLEELMELTRSALKYFGKAAKKELKDSNPDEFDWLDANITAKSDYKATLTQALDHGYGICGHFTALYALLAQQAGLDVVVNHCAADMVPVNITRSDNHLPLFKEVPVGEKVGAHMFLEILTDNRAIPVDPATNLIGLNSEGLQMFRQAQYGDVQLAYGQNEVNLQPPTLFVNISAHVPAGNLTHQGNLKIQNLTETDFAGPFSFDMEMNNMRAQNGGLTILGLAQ
ncbi:transglutaminase domain-containing protein [Candidatus Roizmanbacteria bacterium]|nr:transglutaminase domain-containing protein [Candidatus Roizmanbacteria bacterium]